MRRVAHPYTRWEDYRAGMYGKSETPGEHRDDAYELLTDPAAFASALAGMLQAWPDAAENWLSRPGAKSRSWLGAAACMWRHKAPQHCTRDAWWLLTEDQQARANQVADAARAGWEFERKAQSA